MANEKEYGQKFKQDPGNSTTEKNAAIPAAENLLQIICS